MAKGKGINYSEERDHRYLSAKALKKFLPEGTHRAFVELVKEYPEELAFCFRGNSDNAATVYFQNHAAFNILSTGSVKFDFDHARYMEDWERHRDLLKAAGFSSEKDYVPRREASKKGTESGPYSLGKVTMAAETAKNLTLDQLKALYTGSIRPVIESFFREYKNPDASDYFRKSVTGDGDKSNRDLIEKIVQQKLFLANKELKGGYFFYDLEFAQPYAGALNLESKNQPDMLAIRFDEAGKPERLSLVEVKSKPGSLKNESGVKEHIQGMEEYLSRDRLMEVRGVDACHILEQYAALGLMRAPERPFDEEEFKKLPREILLIFTGEDTLSELERGGYEDYMNEKGYELAKEMLPRSGGIEQIAVYRKEFG